MSAYADLGTLWLNIGVKNKINDEFKQVENTVRQSSKVVEDLGKKFTTYLTVPLTGLGALAIKEFADFEQGMSKVQATAGATAEEMVILTAKAREMGRSTQFSASEVASAMEYMAMAGWNTEQILSGLGGVLNLAAASGEDLASVSDIVTDSLTGFGLTAEDTAKFVDVLAEASRASNTDVSMLGESFKYVAPVAGALGITAEDTAITLGLMANAGIKASQAGTSLRQSILSMVDPTKEAQKLMDEYGISIQKSDDGSVDLRATLDSLKGAMDGLENTQQAQILSTIVGTEASSGLMAVLNATEKDVTNLTEAVKNSSGAAQEMAETMNNNVKGNLNKLKSAFSELLIVIGENLVPMFTSLVEKATELVEWFGSLDEGTQEFIVKMGLLTTAVGPFLTVVGKLTSALTPINSTFGTTGESVGKVIPLITGSGGLVSSFSSLVSVLTGPVGLALMGAVGGFALLNNHAKETAVLSFDDTLKNIDGLSSATAEMVSSIRNDWDELSDQTQQMMDNQSTITSEGLEALKTSYTTHFDELIELEQTRGDERLAWLQTKYEESEGEQRNYYYRLLLAEQESLVESTNNHEVNKQEVLQIMSDLAEGKIANTQEAMNRINEIIAESTSSEIQNSIDKGEELLTLAQNFGALEESLRAEQASKIIQDANAVKEEKITAAQEAYDAEVHNILGLTTITQEERKKMLEDAEARKKDEIRIAHEQKMGILNELGSAYPELSSIVSYETGEIHGNWAQMWNRITKSHETEMQSLVIAAGEDLGDIMGYYNEMSEKANGDLTAITDGHKETGEAALQMADDVNRAGELYQKMLFDVSEEGIKMREEMEITNNQTADGLNKPIDKVQTLHKKIDAMPTSKTINVIINETTRKRTEVYGSSAPSGRAMLTQTFVDDGLVTFNDALYNMTAFNTGFNPSDDIARYDSSVQNRQQDQVISTKGIEERLEKLTELFEQFKELKVYLDKYTLVGELAPGISREMARGVRMKW